LTSLERIDCDIHSSSSEGLSHSQSSHSSKVSASNNLLPQ
jgi:hypothetical protein